jgi:GDPmannose 4,6-dehydratase
MWLILQQDRPRDYVIGTGEAHSVSEFVEEAFSYAGRNWRDYVSIDPRYQRPLEVENLVADASAARTDLGWVPTVTFRELVRIMVDADMEGKKILEQKFPNQRFWDLRAVSP